MGDLFLAGLFLFLGYLLLGLMGDLPRGLRTGLSPIFGMIALPSPPCLWRSVYGVLDEENDSPQPTGRPPDRENKR